jgi:hypothetical protein
MKQYMIPALLILAAFSACGGGNGESSSADITIINKASEPITDIIVYLEKDWKFPQIVELKQNEQQVLHFEWDSLMPGGQCQITYTLNGAQYGMLENEVTDTGASKRKGELWDSDYHQPHSYSVKPYYNYLDIRFGHSNATFTITDKGYTLKGDVYAWKNGKPIRVAEDDPAYLD